MDLDWILNHHGEERQRYFGAVAPPVLQSSIFTFPDVAAMRAAAAHEFDAPFYTRGSNPTVHMLRQKLAALEGAEECLVFASGRGGHRRRGDHLRGGGRSRGMRAKTL